MIKKIECYVAICDICKKPIDDGSDYIAYHDTEAESLEYATSGQYGHDAQEIDGKLVCENCWTMDDDGEYVLREQK